MILIDTAASFPFALPLPVVVAADSKRLITKLTVPQFIHEAIVGSLLRKGKSERLLISPSNSPNHTATSIESVIEGSSQQKVAELRKALHARTCFSALT